MATGSEDGTAKIWDVAKGKERFTLRAHLGRVIEVAFDQTGQRLATASGDGTVKFWDVETGRQSLSLPVATQRVDSMAFSRDGRMLATASLGANGKGRVDLWYASVQGDAFSHE